MTRTCRCATVNSNSYMLYVSNKYRLLWWPTTELKKVWMNEWMCERKHIYNDGRIQSNCQISFLFFCRRCYCCCCWYLSFDHANIYDEIRKSFEKVVWVHRWQFRCNFARLAFVTQWVWIDENKTKQNSNNYSTTFIGKETMWKKQHQNKTKQKVCTRITW